MGNFCVGLRKEMGAAPPAEVCGLWCSNPIAIHRRFSGGCEARKIMGLPAPDYEVSQGIYTYLLVDGENYHEVEYYHGALVAGKVCIHMGHKTFKAGMKVFAEDEWICMAGEDPPLKITEKEYATHEGKRVLVAMKVDGNRIERMSCVTVSLGTPPAPMTMFVIYSEWGELEPMMLNATLEEEERIKKMRELSDDAIDSAPPPPTDAAALDVPMLADHEEAHGDSLKGAKNAEKHVLVHSASSRFDSGGNAVLADT